MRLCEPATRMSPCCIWRKPRKNRVKNAKKSELPPKKFTTFLDPAGHLLPSPNTGNVPIALCEVYIKDMDRLTEHMQGEEPTKRHQKKE